MNRIISCNMSSASPVACDVTVDVSSLFGSSTGWMWFFVSWMRLDSLWESVSIAADEVRDHRNLLDYLRSFEYLDIRRGHI